MSPQFPEALTTPIHYRTLSLSDRGHANLRVTFSVLRHRGSTGSVVATSSASVNVDYDNETPVPRPPPPRWRHEHATRRAGAFPTGHERYDRVR